jgi:hypothetical protein
MQYAGLAACPRLTLVSVRELSQAKTKDECSPADVRFPIVS